MKQRKRRIPGCKLKFHPRTFPGQNLPPKCLSANLLLRQKLDPDTGCWNWTEYRKPSGYGSFLWNLRAWAAHRLSYVCFKGPFAKKFFVCHRCDNPACINPAHLFLGTASDNVHDMIAKGRASWQK